MLAMCSAATMSGATKMSHAECVVKASMVIAASKNQNCTIVKFQSFVLIFRS